MADERRLWAAVLMLAVHDFLSSRTGAHSHMVLRHRARRWFTSSSHKPGSFHWICGQLELDESWLRCRLFESVDQAPVSEPTFLKQLRSSLGHGEVQINNASDQDYQSVPDT